MLKSFEHSIKDINKEKGIVTMYVNAFGNKDSDGDISVKGSFAKTIKENMHRIKHFLNHNPDMLLGVPVKLVEDDFGLLATSQMNMSKQIAKDVFADYVLFAEHNKTLEHSVRVQDIKRDDEDEARVLEYRLWEFSTLYSWGANAKTPLVNIKSMDDLELMIRDGHYSDEKSKQIEELYKRLKDLLKPQPLSDEPVISTLSEKEQILLFKNSLKF